MTSGNIRNIVIVGAGLAGDRCAFSLRDAGFSGRIFLVGEEACRPYDRPPLSKNVLKAAGEEDKTFYRALSDYEKNRIELVLDNRATRLDVRSCSVELRKGGALKFDRLVLATGSDVREIPGMTAGTAGVYYLRRMEDALALREAFAAGGRVIVIGGGVIGLEAAAAAVHQGLDVTLVEAAPRLMGRSACDLVGHYLKRRHQKAGVDIRCSTKILNSRHDGGCWRFALSDGTEVAGEIVIVGIGVTPRLDLASEADLDIAPEGIIASAAGQTSNPAIFAAGEGAYHFNGCFGRFERQENWAHAAAHGDFVGRSILGADEIYSEVPGFWTDQYDISVRTVGRPTGEIDILRGDLEAGRFVVFHITDNRLVGASGVNAARELRAAKLLIRSGQAIDKGLLADDSVEVARSVA